MSTESRTIAIVDDHKIYVEALVELLHLMGYRVTLTAYSAEEFMETMPHAPVPDLALVDLSLPGENGFAVLRWLKEHRPTVRAIVISFAMGAEVVKAVLEAGARSFMAKMLGRAELERVLEEVMATGFSKSDEMRMLDDMAAIRTRARTLGVPWREMEFIAQITQPADLTYEQIADKMRVSKSAVEGYARWFEKHFGPHSRPAIVLWAIAHGLVLGHGADAQLAMSAWRANREFTPPAA